MGIKEIVIFAAGIGVGAFVTNKLLAQKYEEISNQEIESVKQVYHKKMDESLESKKEKIAEDKKKDIKEETENMAGYARTIKDAGYYSPAIEDNDLPYVITPEQYMEPNGYDKLSGTYYEDDVLTDEENEPVDIVKTLGSRDLLDRFGEFETDTLYVRNDKIEADYEFNLEHGGYAG